VKFDTFVGVSEVNRTVLNKFYRLI
jgi:hypothetical protein